MSSRRSDAYRPFAAGGASMRVAAIVVGLGAFGPAQAQDAVRSPVASAPTQEPAAPEAGPDADARGTWSVTFENDIFGDEDRDYTNGVRLDYVTPRNNLSAAGRLAKRGLYGWFSDASDWYGLYTLGQNIYTPSDISLKTPPKTDRPYAGFLYLGAGVAADRGDRLDTLSVEIGIVGPSSLAEESQTIVHEIIGAQEPRGWHNQLDDELGLRLLYERKWKFSADVPVPAFDLSVDWASNVTVALGNVDTSLAIGGVARLGQDLADDYGPPRVRPAVASPGFFRNEDDFSWYVFAGAEGRLVGRNIFIEGNTFGGVDGVEPNRFVADIQAGIAVQLGRVELSYTQVLRTEEYAGQDGMSLFGSVNLRTRF
ncbi:MAG: hypothetical protein CML46_03040 [Rhodobacteraceae bacterium]|nr:hypothetical protein [Paracoccaceae bacterium]MBR25916.1 hypothetical protein [Paracoccaceae bacterium]